MKTILIRILGPAASLALIGCAGMNPWASTPPRREQPTTDPHYSTTTNADNPYLKGPQGQPSEAEAASSGTPTLGNAQPSTAAPDSMPPTPPPPKSPDVAPVTPGPAKTTTTTTTTNVSPPAPSTSGSMPYGKPVPGKKGFVYSPYDQAAGMIDVRDIAPGTKVRDPYTGKVFLVP